MGLVSSRSGRLAGPAGWLLAALLAAVATGLLIEAVSGTSAARAEVGGGGAQGDEVFAIAGRVTPETYGLYLVDLKNHTICVYQWVANSRKLRLMAARTFVFDRRLQEYNTEPLPREIKALIERHRRLGGEKPRK